MSSPFQSFEVVMLNAGFQGIELQESDEVNVLSPLQNESNGVNTILLELEKVNEVKFY
jgi:hypothetical protein